MQDTGSTHPRSPRKDAELVRAYREKRGALRRKNADGNVRKRGRPKIRWLDRVRVISKRRDCQGRSVRPSYIIRRTSTHNTVGLK